MADVQKSAFNLSSATVMMVPAFATDVFSLTPALHSVGMVSEFSISLESSVNELMNGVAQAVVDAKRTNIKPMITGNVYEMTGQNVMRAMALSGASTVVKRGVLTVAGAGSGASLTIASDPIPGEATSAITVIGDIPTGSTILIQRVNGETDYVFPTKSSGVATGAGPFVVPIAGNYIIPAGMSFPIGSRVWIVNDTALGTIDADDLFAVKITGTLSNFDRPVTAVFPKVRMVKGFQISFNETQYGSMPWEMQPLLLSAGEVASFTRGADFGTRAPGRVYVGG